MRLTLRTLLAYLDNTLEPQDAEILRSKLAESGFATQLVQRIRASLADGKQAAPSPDAVGPNEEANVISEYLDSTLPTEQVAEIERACLESDVQLAEAAACHQILTMVLGTPAEVSPQLRQQIYQLPDRPVEDIAAGATSFSSLVIPDQLAAAGPGIEVPDADTMTAVPSGNIEPVGVADSGVSDAPTRLRQAGIGGPQATTADAALAGSKPQRLDDSSIYAGKVRPSRITPWLVSLGLVAVLLFVLAQIFQPLLRDPVAKLDPAASQDPAVLSEATPPLADTTADPEPATTPATQAPTDATAATATPPRPAAAATAPAADDAAADDALDDEGSPTTPAPAATEDDPAAADFAADNAGVAMPSPAGDSTDPPPPPTPAETAAQPVGDADDAAAMADDDADGVSPMVEKTSQSVPPTADDAGKSEVIDAAATVTTDNTLLIAQAAATAAGSEGQWRRLADDDAVSAGATVVSAPGFRAQLVSSDGHEVTLVGPTTIRWSGTADDRMLQVDDGRVLISASEPGQLLNLQLDDKPVQLKFADAEAVVAASVIHFRASGSDPLLAESRLSLTGVLSVQGSIEVTSEDQTDMLTTGQQWVQRGEATPQVTPVELVPDWIDPPDPMIASLDASARQGLMELIAGDKPIEMALREAIQFRRSEVGALAARTLAHLGRGDVYFGGDGVLSEEKQRAYWSDHFNTLVINLDRSAESAKQLRAAIIKMDQPNAETLFRLLAGYSQPQLVDGGDEQLVQWLDSPSMAVRVLALENLQQITGTTLYFRPEETNAVRRATGVKKWEVRLRKEDIRWPE